MKVLLDTHVLIWSQEDPANLGRRMRRLLVDPASELLISAASTLELARLARTRPVMMQLHINVDRAAHSHLLPFGPLAMFAPAPPTMATRDAAERKDAAARAALTERVLAAATPSDEGDAQRAVLWHDATRISTYCSLGRDAAAEQAFAGTRSLFPVTAAPAHSARACETFAPAAR